LLKAPVTASRWLLRTDRQESHVPDITPEAVEAGEDYYHVRYRDPDQFNEVRTPDWAEKPAS